MYSGREERVVVCGSERLRDFFSGAMGLRMILMRLFIVGCLMSKARKCCGGVCTGWKGNQYFNWNCENCAQI